MDHDQTTIIYRLKFGVPPSHRVSPNILHFQTAADRAANDIILGSFKKAIPELTVIGEEGKYP